MTFTNKVDWAIDADRCALLIHDMQTHYLQSLDTEQSESLIANVRAIAASSPDPQTFRLRSASDHPTPDTY